MSHSLSELSQIIEREIQLLTFDKQPKELYEPIAYTLHSGGKRIRPALALAACQMFSDDISPAVRPALGFEVFHNFTLIHDDIMDHSDMRRNRPTVHKKWDANRAILSGDAMLIEAYQLVADSPSEKLPEVIHLFNTTALEVCEGQQYDINFEAGQLVSFEDYLEMIRLKTAVLIAASLKVGAILGGADDTDADNLYKFGIGLGTAFQLHDDVLDVYADENLLGKPIGGDIEEGKKTALYLETVSGMTEVEMKEFSALFHNKMLDRAEKFQKVKTYYDKYKTADKVEARARDFYKKALTALERTDVSAERKVLLYDFGEKIMARKK